MKRSSAIRLISTTVLLLLAGCSYFHTRTSESASTKASPDAIAAIAGANAAIRNAKANDWIWINTEKFAKEAQAAADKGDNAVAIKLADKAKAEAENAIAQYNYEKAHPRGMNGI
jgi:short-subunit dehydrogenase